MSSLRRQMARALGDAMRDRTGIEPAVVSAPPSAVADSPATAIWIEKSERNFSYQDEPSVDADGELLVGARAILGTGEGPALIQQGVNFAIIGSIKCSGRLWVGCRLAPRREELEDEISDLFTEDPSAIGRLMLEVKQPKVGRYVIPWSWYGAAFLDDSDWSPEHAFSERLWSWTRFELEVAILVPRHDPMVSTFVVDFDADFYQSTHAGETVTLPVPLEA